MINKLVFLFRYVIKNKAMSIIYILVLSLIVSSNLLIYQFFVNESTTDYTNRHYYTYHFDEKVNVNYILDLLSDLEKNTDLCEFLVATNPGNVYTYNDYYVASYLKTNTIDEEKRNESMSFGKWTNKDNTFISDSDDLIGVPYFVNFTCNGMGLTHVGNSFSDYRICEKDYLRTFEKADAIDIVLFSENRTIVNNLVDKLGVSYNAEYQDEFLKSGFDSIKNALFISLFLLLVSLYSIISFVEIFLHLQKRDIILFFRCGATVNSICRVYCTEMILVGILSYIIGFLFASFLCIIFNLNFEEISWVTCILVFLIYMILYTFEIIIYIRMTIKQIKLMRLDD